MAGEQLQVAVGLPSPSSHSPRAPQQAAAEAGSRHNTSGEERSNPVWDVDGKALMPSQLFDANGPGSVAACRCLGGSPPDRPAPAPGSSRCCQSVRQRQYSVNCRRCEDGAAAAAGHFHPPSSSGTTALLAAGEPVSSPAGSSVTAGGITGGISTRKGGIGAGAGVGSSAGLSSSINSSWR